MTCVTTRTGNYLRDGLVVVDELVRTSDNDDVINRTRQVSAARVVNVEVQ